MLKYGTVNNNYQYQFLDNYKDNYQNNNNYL